MTEQLKIGQLAKESGATIDTIRFYEEKGLLKPKTRSESGYRLYSVDTINTLNFIQSLKELGFTLSEISSFLEIQITKKGKCSLAQAKVDQKISDIDKKISDLKSIRKALNKISSKCDVSEGENPCHFLELINKGFYNGK